jgi:hypothetical protein
MRMRKWADRGEADGGFERAEERSRYSARLKTTETTRQETRAIGDARDRRRGDFDFRSLKDELQRGGGE